jgi:hypothetical protein
VELGRGVIESSVLNCVESSVGALSNKSLCWNSPKFNTSVHRFCTGLINESTITHRCFREYFCPMVAQKIFLDDRFKMSRATCSQNFLMQLLYCIVHKILHNLP